jgi:hypothetical protein
MEAGIDSESLIFHQKYNRKGGTDSKFWFRVASFSPPQLPHCGLPSYDLFIETPLIIVIAFHCLVPESGNVPDPNWKRQLAESISEDCSNPEVLSEPLFIS